MSDGRAWRGIKLSGGPTEVFLVAASMLSSLAAREKPERVSQDDALWLVDSPSWDAAFRLRSFVREVAPGYGWGFSPAEDEALRSHVREAIRSGALVAVRGKPAIRPTTAVDAPRSEPVVAPAPAAAPKKVVAAAPRPSPAPPPPEDPEFAFPDSQADALIAAAAAGVPFCAECECARAKARSRDATAREPTR